MADNDREEDIAVTSLCSLLWGITHLRDLILRMWIPIVALTMLVRPLPWMMDEGNTAPSPR